MKGGRAGAMLLVSACPFHKSSTQRDFKPEKAKDLEQSYWLFCKARLLTALFNLHSTILRFVILFCSNFIWFVLVLQAVLRPNSREREGREKVLCSHIV